MKRSAGLRDLSRDHHTALSLAQRIARAEGGPALAALAAVVADAFERELAPHFKLEEEGLLVRLVDAGEESLVRRTLEDHRRLRELASRLANGDCAALEPFGTALRAHVRFEEGELFQRYEELFPDG